MEHCAAIIKSLVGDKCIIDLGFIVPRGEPTPAENDVRLDEDELAETWGQLSLATAFARLRRGLHFLRGWPCSMIEVLSPDVSIKTKTLERFKEELRAYEALKCFD